MIGKVLSIPKLIYKSALSLIAMIFKGLGKVVGKLPLIGGKLEKMMGGVSKLVTSAKNPKAMIGGLGKALGGSKLLTAIGGVAKLTKAIPVVGAIATAGFGAIEVGKALAGGNYKKAAFLATKTVAATALTGVGMSAAGLAVDIGGSLAANALFKDSKKKTDAAVAANKGYAAGQGIPIDQGLTLNMKTTVLTAEGSVQSEVTETKKQSAREEIEQRHAMLEGV